MYIYVDVDQKRPPPREGFLFGWFPNASPGGRVPLRKTTAIFSKKWGRFTGGVLFLQAHDLKTTQNGNPAPM